jgi:hypothetical protein
VGLWVLLTQRDTDQDGSPGRVGAAEGQRGVTGLTAEGVRQRVRGMIVRTDGVGPPLAEPPTQVADGTHGQAKRGREARRGFTPESSLEEFLTHSDGDWLWHREALSGGSST